MRRSLQRLTLHGTMRGMQSAANTEAVSPGIRRLLTVGALIGILAYLAAFSWYTQRSPYQVWGTFLLGPPLIAAPLPLVTRWARRDPDPRIARLIVPALWVKLFGTMLRYYVGFHVYRVSDAIGYHAEGSRIAASYRRGVFDVSFGHGSSGTRFVQYVTGWVYTVTSPNKIIGFIVFSWFSFVGICLFYSAFRLAYPKGDHYRYARLIFFLPSLAYWPSSLGKEAWMLLGLGTSAYGVARLLCRRRGAFLLIGAGLWATAMVRPHIAVAIIVSLLIGYLLRRSTTPASRVAKTVGIVLVLGASIVVLSRAAHFFGVDSLTTGSANSVLEETQGRTSEGGSVFHNHPVRSPKDLPVATITVLFRPLPFEAHNLQSLLASGEGLVLAGIVVGAGPRLRRLPRALVRVPYLAFAATFTLVFIVAFSNLANFGILARERVQMLPMMLALLCVPIPGSSTTDNTRAAPRFRLARRTDSRLVQAPVPLETSATSAGG